MHLPSTNWHEAIQIRHSRRKYLTKAIDSAVLQQLQTFSEEFRPFGDTAYAVLVTQSPEEVFKGIVGAYGKITGAPAYIAFIGKTGAPHVDVKVGYLGEGIILEATRLGLNTCWIGGFFKREVVERHLKLIANERVFAITPVGYTAERYTFDEKLMTIMARSKQRKELHQLCTGIAENKWAAWQKTALADARIAPSAVNRQPWRFEVGEGEITVLVDNPSDPLKDISKQLDCGIALLHLQAGAEHSGKNCQIKFLEHPQVARLLVK